LRYFVIAPDGSKYGPADLATLRAWVVEGRISPDTILEEVASHQRAPARMIAGLFPSEVPSFSATGSVRNPKTEYTKGSGNGNADAILSYICSVLSILCCGFFIIGAFVYASRAIAKGNPGGKAARIVAWIFLLIWIVTTIIEIIFFKQLVEFLQGQLSGTGIELTQ
jgi:hypothetical protein